MKTRKAIIVDDEPFVREDLREMLRQHPEIEVVAEAGSLDEAVKCLEKVSLDVAFLDIQLRGGSGFDLVPFISPDCRIIFFTAYDHYAVRAFEVNALDYLLKPVNADRLAESLKKLGSSSLQRDEGSEKRTAFETDDQIFIQTASERRFVRLKEISVITSMGGNYSALTYGSGLTVTLRRTLKQWEEILPEHAFVRIHRSTIINLDYLERLKTKKNGNGLLFLSGHSQAFDVSRRFLPALNKEIEHRRK